MSLPNALVARLADDAAFTALVGDRIYPGVLPLGVAYPAVTYVTTGSIDSRNYAGRAGTMDQRVQFHCWSDVNADAEATAAAVVAAWVDFSGQVAGLVVEDVELADLFNLHQNPAKDADETIFRVVVDLRIIRRY